MCKPTVFHLTLHLFYPEHSGAEHMSALVVFDFETSGLKPSQGARVIEVGAVRVEDGVIRACFQQLINPGFPVTSFITGLTGISNAMLSQAPGSAEVLPAFVAFCGDLPMVAHNARFDRAFLQAELARLGLSCANACACSLLVARRVMPDAPHYRLAALARHCGLNPQGSWHRALTDAMITAQLWLYMEERLRRQYGLRRISFALMQHLTCLQRNRVPAWLRVEAARQRGDLFDAGAAFEDDGRQAKAGS